MSTLLRHALHPLFLALLLPLYTACNPTGGNTKDTSVEGDADADADADGDGDADGDTDADTDTGCETVWYQDLDGDGFGAGKGVTACEAPKGYVDNDGDCDDANSEVHPDAREVCDGLDNDCDRDVDEAGAAGESTWYLDADGDGVGGTREAMACEAPRGHVATTGDCDDSDPAIYPDAVETCDGVDNDCDGETDEAGSTGKGVWYSDVDGDGYGTDAATRVGCDPGPGWSASAGDCNDLNAAVNPGATELPADMLDSNCDGTELCYQDLDRDTYGSTLTVSSPNLSCEDAGESSLNTDCNDGSASINPGASEITADGIDQNCDGGEVCYLDSDTDGYGGTTTIASADTDCTDSRESSLNTDCNDGNSAINPGARETAGDGTDQNCDGRETCYVDVDDDGYRPDSTSTVTSTDTDCLDSGEALSTDPTGDCNDSNAAINPGATEICNGVDDNCDGTADNDPVDGTRLAADADSDGFGEAGSFALRCVGVANDLDCNDANMGEPVVVDDNGTGRLLGTLSDPLASIQEGIDWADECVVVLGGFYMENIDFSGKNLEVVGLEGAGTTVIDGGGSDPVVSVNSGETGAVLRGFTLQNGGGYEETWSTSTSCGSGSTCYSYYTSYCGGGLFVDGANGSFSDLLIIDNVLNVPADSVSGDNSYYYYSFGGGICLRNTSSTLDGVDLYYNFAEDGGAIFTDSDGVATFTHGRMSGNTAIAGAAVENEGTFTLSNSILSWNTSSGEYGAFYMPSGVSVLTNVTLGGNGSTNYGALAAVSGRLNFVNSIIYGTSGSYGAYVATTVTSTITYNDVYGYTSTYAGITAPTGSLGNISSNPRFTSATDDGDFGNDNWTLSSTSPCINAGNPASAYADADGTRNDMGAYGGPGGSW